jgi:signal transduction histidine kinase
MLKPPSTRRAILLALIGALLLLGSLGFLFYMDRIDRAQKADQLGVQGAILASTVTAALTFDDRDTAREYVDALEANPEVRAAAVYDQAGDLFAAYRRTASDALPAKMPAVGNSAEDGRLETVAAVPGRDGEIGRVYVSTVLEAWPRRLERYGVIVFMTLMAALAAVVLAVSQAMTTHANAELGRRARELSSANASLNAEMAERARAEEALRHSQKMEVIGQLTGGVAHDFNNLLQVILGNLDNLRRHAGGHAELASSIDAALRGAERAATLTQSLLAFARRQPLAPRPLDVNQVIANVAKLLHRTLGEDIHIEPVLAPGVWRVCVDANQLDTALMNLAINARDAMPQGGKLIIETSNIRLQADQLSGEMVPGYYVLITVRDSGSGMSDQTREHAFEPFFTTKPSGKGSGLGLSQVYGFIRQSGGQATIESTPGAGSAVSLYLPRLASTPLGPTVSDDFLPVPRGRGELVLVVEDENDVRDYVVAVIRELGYDVVEARDGPSALTVVEREPRLRLLFSDIGLPGEMSGRQLATRAMKLRRDLAVLLTTGYARDTLSYRGPAGAGPDLIGKPYTYAALGAKLREVLDVSTASPNYRPDSP